MQIEIPFTIRQVLRLLGRQGRAPIDRTRDWSGLDGNLRLGIGPFRRRTMKVRGNDRTTQSAEFKVVLELVGFGIQCASERSCTRAIVRGHFRGSLQVGLQCDRGRVRRDRQNRNSQRCEDRSGNTICDSQFISPLLG